MEHDLRKRSDAIASGRLKGQFNSYTGEHSRSSGYGRVRQTITIRGLADLKKFEKEFIKLVDVVRKADGSYMLHIDRPSKGLKSMFVSKADFDRVVSPQMYGQNPAFSKTVAGGRFKPDRLNAAYGALAREQAKNEVLQRGQHKILNRREYIAYYYGDMPFYPTLAASLNGSSSRGSGALTFRL